MGDVGSNLMLCIGTLYLLKFYTDELGMPAYYGGIIFLVAKFFTAFTEMPPDFYSTRGKNIGPKGQISSLYFICSGSGGVNCNAPVYRHHLLFAG